MESSFATILFTDIVGSTDRIAELGNHRWRQLLQKHHVRVRRELRRFGGLEVNTAGDGFLATFGQPLQALHCAWTVRDAVRELGLEVRSGIHAGQVEGPRSTLAGLAVHTAARVMAEAAPGEVLVSNTVHDLVAGSGWRLEDRGVRTLKGIPGEWRLYAVTAVPDEPAAESRRTWLPSSTTGKAILVGVAAFGLFSLGTRLYFRTLPVEERPDSVPPPAASSMPAIAVLPFTVRAAGLDLWREGMVDVLSTNLDGAGGLRAVDSRTVMARWRENVAGIEPPDLERALGVAQQTGARYALLGSVVSSGSGMRIAADVYDVATREKLGHGEVEGSPDSIFSLVDRLSIETLRPISRELPHVELSSVTTNSVSALKAYLEGEVLYRGADFRRAHAAYARALREDSTFALAHHRLALVCGWSTEAGCSEEETTESSARAHRLAARLPEREALLVRGEFAFQQGEPQAFEIAQAAVRRYPDDAEAWYFLGEVFFHMGGQFLAEYEDTDRALEKSLELDSLFTPAYLHLIGNAFMYHADGGRAARLIREYEGMTADTERDVMHRVSFGLAAGGTILRRAAEAEVDSLSTEVLFTIMTDYLMRSRFWPASETVLRELAEPDRVPEGASFVLFWSDIARGRIGAALEYLDEPMIGGWRECGLYYASAHAMPLPAGVLERFLAPHLADSLAPVAFYGGALAADEGRWSDHARMLARLKARAEELHMSGDSAMGRLLRGGAKGLDAYGQWKRGRREQALELLKSGQREGTSFFEIGINSQMRWWLATLLLEMDKPREAEPYLRSLTGGVPAPPRGFGGGFWQEPLAAYELGRVYEDLGDLERARRSYEFFADGWKEADPELQPRVAEARAAVRRLSALSKE